MYFCLVLTSNIILQSIFTDTVLFFPYVKGWWYLLPLRTCPHASDWLGFVHVSLYVWLYVHESRCYTGVFLCVYLLGMHARYGGNIQVCIAIHKCL